FLPSCFPERGFGGSRPLESLAISCQHATCKKLTNKFVYADATPQFKITQPKGAGSFDGNLNGRTFTLPFAISKYYYGGSSHAWGKPVSRIPLITIVFKNDGTTQVLEPRPYSWDTYYEADGLPASPWILNGTAGTIVNVGTTESGKALQLTGGPSSYSQYANRSISLSSATIETVMKIDGSLAGLKFETSNNKYASLDVSGSYVMIAGSGTIACDGTKWHNYRVTITDSALKLYIDGVLKFSGSPGVVSWTPQIGVTISEPQISYGTYHSYWNYIVVKNGVYPQP
ncbi:MAG: hypothetical protein HYX75_04220, partial [Acidobacteria bacterium]|nr:hypothetical protein [Acidobacteriota bacterium]